MAIRSASSMTMVCNCGKVNGIDVVLMSFVAATLLLLVLVAVPEPCCNTSSSRPVVAVMIVAVCNCSNWTDRD